MVTQIDELSYRIQPLEQRFGACLPFLLFGLGGIFGGVEFEDVGQEKASEGFDNVVGDFFVTIVAF